jgi:sulfur-carrier protein adenylyltransferase/sulfurtransferase
MSWEITPEELQKRLLAERTPVLLDVRRPDEVAVAVLAGAVHIPLDELEERASELDPEAETIVYCHHGVRSLSATAYLRQLGFRSVRSLAGGIDRWSLTIDPSVARYG